MKTSNKVSETVAPTTNKASNKKGSKSSNTSTATKDSKDKVKIKTLKGEKETKLTKAEIDTKNIKDTVKQAVVSQREIKYKYPEDIINDPSKKKSFRQVARNTIKNLENAIVKAGDPDSKAYRIASKKLKNYKAEVLLVPEA